MDRVQGTQFGLPSPLESFILIRRAPCTLAISSHALVICPCTLALSPCYLSLSSCTLATSPSREAWAKGEQ